ncbi:N-6 DNA methylase [bacterium (Candidatus Gribaldobacteria) CG08_land_8_20_14_0_20_39_15]|uniref:site-specific DNA-methyltransferase (adenine-specific) n=1 Tax=bacterium (Candidatus Gribaldobacteria) CG08_land_8_20_14_0_20_39_15 TaxID=2014273 RepID=A0A2M6XV68_9BACT|nr:MAG: N-6 DNA methylase [bacterium (Candidatus Gribaldobacteria) CG08_land_8_20_14_0_20_39_15]
MQNQGLKKISLEKANGVVYTPEWIVETILDFVGFVESSYRATVVDPACGDGAFLTMAAKRIISGGLRKKLDKSCVKQLLEKNVVGFDIDKKAVAKCKNRLDQVAEKYNINNVQWQIYQGDSLDKEFVLHFFKKFDFVVGNPPYVRIQHLEKEKREKIQQGWRFCQNGSTDIFIAFFELGVHLLSKIGKLGYITPNTFLKTKAGENLRWFLRNSNMLKTLIDFEHHQIFDNVTTYSLITILDKYHFKDFFYLYKSNGKNIEFIDEIKVKELDINNWVLTSNETSQKLQLIRERGVPLGQIAQIHVGITTLADNYYIFQNPIFNGDKAIIRLKDGREFTIEKKILKPIIKASVLKNAGENQNRFVIFPYEKINGRHFIIPEAKLTQQYPLSYKYFLTIKDILLARDKGKPNPVTWYAFGRSQGLDTSFGRKILTSPINKTPNFIVWEKEDYTFYAGYCIKYTDDLNWLASILNSDEMNFYISHTSRDYQNNYKSFAKSFIENFTVPNNGLAIRQNQFVF